MKAARTPQIAAATQGGSSILGWHLRNETRLSTQPAVTALRLSCEPTKGRRKLAWRGELLRKARVYGCKPERWLLQRSFEITEECSC